MIHRIKNLSVTLTKVTVLLILLSSIIVAQDAGKIIELDAKAVGNLKTAIKSDNPGLRKSGIYFAGKYSANEVGETLVEQLKVEKDPELRILLVRVLYIIDDQKFMDQIKDLALTDADLKVRRMASAVYSAMSIKNSPQVVDLSK